MKVAAACYPIDWIEGFDCYAEKLSRWVGEAAAEGAQLLVFPEYGAMELAAIVGREKAGDLEASMRAVSDLLPRAWDLHADLAARHGVHILSASGPFYEGERPVNRAMFFTPGGKRQAHDKQIMTRWERDPMDVRPGAPLVVMETALGKIGVLICYDSEFPNLGRALVAAGAEIILVPSATETLAGFTRVRVGAMARALEGQCVTIHAPTQGAAPWNLVVDANSGRASVYGPPDKGFPETGIIAEGGMNAPGWTFAEVSLDAVREVRRDGHVLNHAHWGEHMERAQSVAAADLR